MSTDATIDNPPAAAPESPKPENAAPVIPEHLAAPEAPAPATAAELARRLYEESPLPVARIARMLGIYESSLYRMARREGWRPRRQTLAAGKGPGARRFATEAAGAAGEGLSEADVARAFVSRTPESLAADRREIVARIWQRAALEIDRSTVGAAELNARVGTERREKAREGELAILERASRDYAEIMKDLDGKPLIIDDLDYTPMLRQIRHKLLERFMQLLEAEAASAGIDLPERRSN